jgi:ferredoxin
VLPVPFDDATLRFAMAQAEAIDQLNKWGGQPLPIAASAWHDGFLHVRLSGATAAVCAARDNLGGEVVDASHAQQLWMALREQTHAFFSPANDAGRALWRIAVPTVCKPLDLPGAQLVEWGGGQRWWLAPDDSAASADRVRAARRPPAATPRCSAMATSPWACSRRCHRRWPRSTSGSRTPSILPASSIRSACTTDSESAGNPIATRDHSDPTMQTTLADFLRNTPEGEEAKSIVGKCVHCGFCTATCPTYQLLGDELDGRAAAST